MPILSPNSPAELADVLRKASAHNHTVECGGNFSKALWGGPVQDANVRLSTAKLNTVLQYEPRDLTISVGAGMSYAALDAAGGREPADDSAGPAVCVKGDYWRVIATNLSGSRRRLFGTARDLVIGLQFATMDGKLVQSGGMVVKNVAGLDMGKLLIGSYGTLGVLTAINFKLIPSPPEKATFVRSFATAAEAVTERNRLLTSVLQPAGIDLLNPSASEILGHKGFYWCCRWGERGGAEAVSAGAEQLPGDAERYAAGANRGVFGDISDAAPEGAVARISTRLQGLRRCSRRRSGRWWYGRRTGWRFCICRVRESHLRACWRRARSGRPWCSGRSRGATWP
jgi:glycolate oxidase FAD binding subunit